MPSVNGEILRWARETAGALHGFGSMADFFDGSRLKEVDELSPEAKQRLSSVEVIREKVRTTTPGEDTTTTIEQVIKIKVWDKMRALELLGRHLGLWKDKVEHQADFSLLNTLRAIERREDEAK